VINLDKVRIKLASKSCYTWSAGEFIVARISWIASMYVFSMIWWSSSHATISRASSVLRFHTSKLWIR